MGNNTPKMITADRMIALHGQIKALWWAKRHKDYVKGIDDQVEYWESVIQEISNRTEKITIGACWDGRDYYNPDYVNRLYRACVRNTTIPFDFVLYVGPEARGRLSSLEPAIQIFQTDLPFWWSGMLFWRKNPPLVDTRTILYLDLDQVIVGSLDDLILYSSDQAYMKDYPARCCPRGMEKDGNASVTLIRHGAGARVWEEYVKAGKPTWSPLNPPANRNLPLAVQSIINDRSLAIPFETFPEEWVASYKLRVLPHGLPEDCRIVSFHGRPKPHEVDCSWVKENWR